MFNNARPPLRLQYRPSWCDNRNKRPGAFLLLILRIFFVTSLFIFLLLLSDSKTRKRITTLFQDTTANVLYRLRMEKTTESPFTLFTSQNPIFTNPISSQGLQKVLAHRRRVIGGVFNNSLIAACPSDTNIDPQTITSWISVRGVREVVVVHYTDSRDESHLALKDIDSVDKLGRVIYVNVIRQGPGVPTPATSTGRWERARAFNLGATIASGTNLLFVDCGTMVSANALTNHTLRNETVFVQITKDTPDLTDIRTIQMIYVRRHVFLNLFGFDERMDVPGFDMAELVERLTERGNLKWQAMHPFSSHPARIQRETPLVSEAWVDGMNTSKRGAINTPELALYVTAFARNEMPLWNGELIDGSQSMLSMRPVKFRVLRSQCNIGGSPPIERSAFTSTKENDFRLWIHATLRKHRSVSILDVLSPDFRAALVLKAHRKLLHDQYGIPWKLLMLIEGSHIDENTAGNASLEASFADRKLTIADIDRNIDEYSPITFNLLWRKSRILLVHVKADRAIELFKSVTWAILLAVARSRALILVGDLRGTPLVDLLDIKAVSQLLSEEYNVRLDIIGREQLFNCSDPVHTSCWDGDDVFNEWDEYYVTESVADAPDEPSKHLLLHIVAKKVVQWDDREKETMWQRQLAEHAFACITISQGVKNVIAQNSHDGWDDLTGKTALYMTNSSHDRESVQSFVLGYLARRHPSHEHKPLIFVSGDMVNLEGESETQRAFRNVAELWVGLQCDRIVFDDEMLPNCWRGVDNCVIEWRRVHGVLSVGKGVTHVRSSDIGAAIPFHELIFFIDPGATAPSRRIESMPVNS